MKRALIVLLAVLLLFGCSVSETAGNRYTSSVFDANLPEHFERVPNVDLVCFAPYGIPLLSSCITFYSTELNPYFHDFSADEYVNALTEFCGYDSIALTEAHSCIVDGYDAQRFAFKVCIEQGTHDLILYAIHADHTYFFTLLNRDTDSYIDAFDDMMESVDLKGIQS